MHRHKELGILSRVFTATALALGACAEAPKASSTPPRKTPQFQVVTECGGAPGGNPLVLLKTYATEYEDATEITAFPIWNGANIQIRSVPTYTYSIPAFQEVYRLRGSLQPKKDIVNMNDDQLQFVTEVQIRDGTTIVVQDGAMGFLKCFHNGVGDFSLPTNSIQTAGTEPVGDGSPPEAAALSEISLSQLKEVHQPLSIENLTYSIIVEIGQQHDAIAAQTLSVEQVNNGFGWLVMFVYEHDGSTLSDDAYYDAYLVFIGQKVLEQGFQLAVFSPDFVKLARDELKHTNELVTQK